MMTHTLMIQGTSSDAGKSLLVTALCRLLQRRGFSVAPFKPQNMSLNSAVTMDGGEIGRAQAVQAAACSIPPLTDMNPILLKPNSDVGSQVVVCGRALGNYTAEEYHQLKPALMEQVVDAHQRLQSQYPVTLVEGAGSPAEINLREHDLANMGFAERIECPVIIVADIDRGGVFAHLVGTFELLSETGKRRVKGFVINKFRGDIQLLKPGIAWLEQRIGLPVLGVIPFIPDLQIEAEDSLQLPQAIAAIAAITPKSKTQRTIEIVIPSYPRISNHTDFAPLQCHPRVNVRLLHDSQHAQGADLLILPGSKSVRSDLDWLISQGWADRIKRHLRYGGKVLGICGGYQMLGHWIHDPNGVESTPGSSQGLNLIDMQTTLMGEKVLSNRRGVLVDLLNDDKPIEVAGYEIHMGVSEGAALQQPLFMLDEGDGICVPEGVRGDDGLILGSYLHGLFDKAELLDTLLNWVAPSSKSGKSGKSSNGSSATVGEGAIQGVDGIGSFDYALFREQQIDKLADHVEQALCMDQILAILALKS